MALTTKQRNALPASAFAYPRERRFPIPTAAQAKAAGIPEGQRQRMLRNAVARAAQSHTRGSYSTVAPKARARSRPGGRDGVRNASGWYARKSPMARRGGRARTRRRGR